MTNINTLFAVLEELPPGKFTTGDYVRMRRRLFGRSADVGTTARELDRAVAEGYLSVDGGVYEERRTAA